MVDTLFWPTNFMVLYPDRYWTMIDFSTIPSEPTYKIYKQIVAAEIWQ
jgi:hypothetical protein